MKRVVAALTGCMLACCLLPVAAPAAPPAAANPAWAPWFKSLQRPDGGGSCCSPSSDCRMTEFRVEGGHYEARYRRAWLVIPDGKVVPRGDNPTGRAVLCAEGRGRDIIIYCFVPGAES